MKRPLRESPLVAALPVGLLLLAGALGAAVAQDSAADHAPHAPTPEQTAAPAVPQVKGEFVDGEVFSVATDTAFPSTVPTHFHSADPNTPDNFGPTTEIAEVGDCCGGGQGEEVRGLAEFPVSSEGGSSATLTFDVTAPGGLFGQPGGDFDILIEAYVGNGVEELTDYGAPSVGQVGIIAAGSVGQGDSLEYDVSEALAEVLRAGGDLGIRLRAGSSPNGAAVVFEQFALEQLAQRSSIGGSGAVFCPDGSLKISHGPKGSCTDPLGPGDSFGTAVSVSGNVVAIGVPGDDDAGDDSGAVFIFLRDRGQLVYQEKLTVPPEYAAGGFGRALKVEGGVLVIGAPDEPTSARKGVAGLQAAIFQRLQQGFSFKQPVFSQAATPGSGFGSSLDVQGNLMVIGAPNAGVASVFRFNNGFPNELGVVGPPGGKGAGSGFGRAVAVSQGKFAVTGGTPLVAGSVGIFQAVGDNLSNLGTMTAADSQADFGRSVTMDGDNIFVGAPGATFNPNGTGSRTGAVFGFAPNGAMRGRFTPPQEFTGGLFGVAVASSQGRLAIGQPGGGTGSTASSRVYLYEATPSELVQVDQVTQVTSDEAGIGNSLALNDGNLLAASPTTGTITGVLDTRAMFSADFEGTGLSPTEGFTFPLAVATIGSGAGRITSQPAGIDCPGSCGAEFGAAITVTLSATPAPGSSFVGWGGNCDGTGGCSVQMLAARSVTATFEAAPAQLIVPSFSRPAPAREGTIGSPYFLEPVVRNTGVSAAGSSFVKLFLSLDNDSDLSDDIEVGEVPVSALAPGAEQSVRINFTMPDLNSGGSYTFWPIFDADSRNQVPEETENLIFRSNEPYTARSAFGKGRGPAVPGAGNGDAGLPSDATTEALADRGKR